jgi:transcriptional regulator
MDGSKLDLMQGTLDLMVLQTLAAMGPQHGYGLARRVEQVSGREVLLNQGTIHASLVRLEQRRLIRATWGTSENNRRARFYTITRAGRKALDARTSNWERLTAVMARVLGQTGEEPGR